MPAQTSKTRFDLNASIKAHRSDPAEAPGDFSGLPGGITNGRARLIEAKIDVYKKGKTQGQKYLYLAATVVEPDFAIDNPRIYEPGKNGTPGSIKFVGAARQVKVEGRRTYQTLPLCATERNGKNGKEIVEGDTNVTAALNVVKLIGGEECCEGLEGCDDLLELLKSLISAETYIRFSTNESNPTAEWPVSRVWEKWHGVAEDYEAPENPEIDDTTAEASAGSVAVPEADEETTTEEPANEEQGEEDDGLDELAVAAEENNAKAQKALKAAAVEAGIQDADFESATWEEVVALVRAARKLDPDVIGDAEPQEEEALTPKKGDSWLYTPIDPKTKKPMVDPKTKKPKKPTEHEVMATDKAKKTADLKCLMNTKLLYKGVPWDALKPVEA